MTRPLESMLEEIKELTPLVVKIFNGTAPQLAKQLQDFQLARPSADFGQHQHIHNFFSLVEQALKLVQNTINQLERKIEDQQSIFPQEILLNREIDNWESLLMHYQRLEESLLQLLQLHRYQRLSQEEREKLIANYMSGGSNKVLVKSFPHQIAQFETLEGIALRFGILDWREIAEFNNILPSEIATGQMLLIPVKFSPAEANKEFFDLPVFGSLQGTDAFGHDLPNQLNHKVVTHKGLEDAGREVELFDLEVLDGIDTLVQGLENIVQTAPGEHPTLNTFGFTGIVDDNIPNELRESWLSIRLEQALQQDPRIATIRIESIRERDEAVEIEATVLTKGNTAIKIERSL